MSKPDFFVGLRVGTIAQSLGGPHDWAILDDKGVTAFATVWGQDDQAEAYAHLFAAAPAMLAALKTMRKTLIDMGGDPMPTLDALIDTAEGRQ